MDLTPESSYFAPEDSDSHFLIFPPSLAKLTRKNARSLAARVLELLVIEYLEDEQFEALENLEEKIRDRLRFGEWDLALSDRPLRDPNPRAAASHLLVVLPPRMRADDVPIAVWIEELERKIDSPQLPRDEVPDFLNLAMMVEQMLSPG